LESTPVIDIKPDEFFNQGVATARNPRDPNGKGFTPQISSQYRRIERSVEKKPERAMLSIDILIQWA
jgi:hypothetical protein